MPPDGIPDLESVVRPDGCLDIRTKKAIPNTNNATINSLSGGSVETESFSGDCLLCEGRRKALHMRLRYCTTRLTAKRW